jgi:hypothetical protein
MYSMTAEEIGAQYPGGYVKTGKENITGYGEKKREQTSTWPSVSSIDGDCVVACTEQKQFFALP